MRRLPPYVSMIASLGLMIASPLWAWDGLVEKQTFELENFTTQNGETIPEVKVGWEAYGELNEARDNAILITHFFSGTSHAAGRYEANGPMTGYWDAIIGPGKPLDTDRFYIISSDTLVNLNAFDPNVITTGPATINPETNTPWGMDFPVVTIRDFVEVQRALLESQGIESLYAVMGPSMGALQAIEWASAYPDRVERLVSVIGSGAADPWLVATLSSWAAPIRLDANWNEGDYYDGEPPTDGLKEALKLVTLNANHPRWVNRTFNRDWAESDRDPAQDINARYAIEQTLDELAEARADTADANHLLYLVRANQTFVAGHGDSFVEGLRAIAAPTLMLYSERDQVFAPEGVRRTAQLIRGQGNEVVLETLKGNRGHLDGVLSIDQASDVLREFLK
ncbi:E22 family MetX-like putative esterase [Vreelandella sp. EE22]